MAWTADDLVEQVRRTSFMPSVPGTSGGFSDTDILAHADEVMATEVVPTIITMREEWFVKGLDIPLTVGVDSYRLPNRNIAGRIRDVQLVRNGIPYNLARYEPETYLNFSNGLNPGIPTGFMLENNAIKVIPSPATADTLRVKYFFRPNRLTLTSDASASRFASIATASPTTQTITTVANYGLVAGAKIDMVRNTPNFETVFYSVTVLTTPTAFTFTVATSELPAELVNGTSYDSFAGCWITPEYTTPVLQCPTELHGYWMELTSAKVMEAHGDAQNAALARQRADRYRVGMVDLLAPRTEGEPRKLLGGMLWGGGRNVGWWR